jgi:hypothetical protein
MNEVLKSRLFLIILFILVKSLNFMFVVIDKYGIFIIAVSLAIYKIPISFYIFFVTAVIKIVLKLENPINNVLCINNFTRSINMNTAVNIKNMKNHSTMYVLNKIVDGFIEGFEIAALDTRKFKIKEGIVYRFRTHGAIYMLFQKKMIRSHDEIIDCDVNSVAVKKVIEGTRLKLFKSTKLSFSDKITFLVERMLVQYSFTEMLKFFERIYFEDIQVHDFEAVFTDKKVYIKIKD